MSDYFYYSRDGVRVQIGTATGRADITKNGVKATVTDIGVARPPLRGDTAIGFTQVSSLDQMPDLHKHLTEMVIRLIEKSRIEDAPFVSENIPLNNIDYIDKRYSVVKTAEGDCDLSVYMDKKDRGMSIDTIVTLTSNALKKCLPRWGLLIRHLTVFVIGSQKLLYGHASTHAYDVSGEELFSPEIYLNQDLSVSTGVMNSTIVHELCHIAHSILLTSEGKKLSARFGGHDEDFCILLSMVDDGISTYDRCRYGSQDWELSPDLEYALEPTKNIWDPDRGILFVTKELKEWRWVPNVTGLWKPVVGKTTRASLGELAARFGDKTKIVKVKYITSEKDSLVFENSTRDRMLTANRKNLLKTARRS